MAVQRRPERVARGQHVLRSSRLAATLVRDACVEAGDLVVDLGAGTGVLTRALAATGARVLAVELDPVLAAALGRRCAERPNVTVQEADIQRWKWPTEPFSVVSNLPFAGSGSVLGRLLGDPSLPLRRAHVILQWEAAVKDAAVWPATLNGTYWKAWYELTVVGRLSRNAFAPRPSVDAGILRITRRPRPLVPARACRDYRRFVARAFGSGRPIETALRPALSARDVRALAATLGFSPAARPRDLDAGQWARLFLDARHGVRR